ncbi:neurogenic locus protein delta-like protein, partial [Leptotrombidium deliense]
MIVNLKITGHSNANQMITKIATQTWLNVNQQWTRNVSNADGKSLTFAYRVVCEENYYGENCETLCKPRDDQFGHFTCLSNGEKRCLQGWTGSYCDKDNVIDGERCQSLLASLLITCTRLNVR